MNNALQKALELQKNGQIEQAKHIYLEILEIEPKDAAANHALGLMEINLNGALAALPRLEIAVMEKPENEQFWVSYIGALMQSRPADIVADALELGQKYGLGSESAKTLAAEFVKELEASHSCDFEYKEKKKIHLGCGTNYIDGWLNVDLDSPLADEHADFRNPLPYIDASADYIFNEHFLEHITREEGLAFLKECRRVLKAGGIFRVSTPDLRWLAAQYSSGKLDEWHDVRWVPETSCRLLNEGMRSWGHQFVYDLPELLAILSEAGFSDVHQVKYRESSYHELAGLECRPWHQELIVEAR